jgi:hypothetical protein
MPAGIRSNIRCPGPGADPGHPGQQGTNCADGLGDDRHPAAADPELAVVSGPHNANYGAAGHLTDLVLAFVRRRFAAKPDPLG